MAISFYFCSWIAVLATLRVIIYTNPVHTLLYLIISLLAISGIFFSLGAYFPGAIEVIVYAGAVMVLFTFVVMILNLNKSTENQNRRRLKSLFWIGSILISLILLSMASYTFIINNGQNITINSVTHAKSVGISLFGPYILIAELTSMLLLSGLVVVFHIGRENSHIENG